MQYNDWLNLKWQYSLSYTDWVGLTHLHPYPASATKIPTQNIAHFIKNITSHLCQNTSILIPTFCANILLIRWVLLWLNNNEIAEKY